MAPLVPDCVFSSARNPGSQLEQARRLLQDEEDNEDTQRRLCQESAITVYRLKEECALAKADLARKRREVCTTYETMSPQPGFRRRSTVWKLSEGPNAGGNSSMGYASVPPTMSPPETAPPRTSDWNWNKWPRGESWNKHCNWDWIQGMGCQ